MIEKLKKAIKKSKTKLAVVGILWIILSIVFVAPMSISIKAAQIDGGFQFGTFLENLYLSMGHLGTSILTALSIENIGYFCHNAQSVRVLRDLEKLNISIQTLDGILAHNGEILINKYEYNKNKTNVYPFKRILLIQIALTIFCFVFQEFPFVFKIVITIIAIFIAIMGIIRINQKNEKNN